MNWQPIDTAPKDEIVLVWRDGYPMLTAYHEECVWMTIGRRHIDPPTHWMPLPAPPLE